MGSFKAHTHTPGSDRKRLPANGKKHMVCVDVIEEPLLISWSIAAGGFRVQMGGGGGVDGCPVR